MLHDALHEPLTQSATTMRLEHEYVPQIGVGGAIADHAGEANLRAFRIINAKAQRMLDGSRHDLARDTFRPVRVREKAANDLQIQEFAVCANQETAMTMLNDGFSVATGWPKLHGDILQLKP